MKRTTEGSTKPAAESTVERGQAKTDETPCVAHRYSELRLAPNNVLHSSKFIVVCPSVCNGNLPTFTGNRVDPEAAHSGLEAASGMLGKRQFSAVGRHDGKLRTCMAGE